MTHAGEWQEAGSLTEAVEQAARVLQRDEQVNVDVRPTGVRVGARQALTVVVETSDEAGVGDFWQQILGYDADPDGTLRDPLGRSPSLRIVHSEEDRPLRQRIHLDVVRPAAVVERVQPGPGGGPWGLRHADPDGNEVDLVPGDPLEGAEDWQAVFSAIACYRTQTTTQQVELAREAARRADDAGFPLGIDLRPGLVVLDTGKDRWDAEAHGLDLDFTDLARDIQQAARGLGAEADRELPRFVQLFLDASDVDALKAFWLEALDYTPDPRDGVSDINDPRRIGPDLVFQQIDLSETGRLSQRNRMHVELALTGESAGRRIADPDGNELVITTHG